MKSVWLPFGQFLGEISQLFISSSGHTDYVKNHVLFWTSSRWRARCRCPTCPSAFYSSSSEPHWATLLPTGNATWKLRAVLSDAADKVQSSTVLSRRKIESWDWCCKTFLASLWCHQCDQIGHCLKVLGSKFSYKSCPNFSWLFGLFRKRLLLGNFWKSLCYFIIQHLVTLGALKDSRALLHLRLNRQCAQRVCQARIV